MSAVKADNTTPKELTEVINGVELLDASDTKQKTTETGEYLIRTGQAYKLRVTFDLKKYNENLNNGDYFTVVHFINLIFNLISGKFPIHFFAHLLHFFFRKALLTILNHFDQFFIHL